MHLGSSFRRLGPRAALLVAALGVVASLVPGFARAGGYTDASYLTPPGTVGQPYAHRVEWKPGNGCPPYSYAVVGGDLPPGLSLSSDGYISGTPTKEGRWVFYIRQTDLCGPEGEGNSPFVVDIGGASPPPPRPPPLIINGGSLPPAEATLPYTASLSASGGSGPRSWSLTGGQLPQGLTLSADGRVSGTPQSGGNYGFTATVSAGGGSASADFSLTVVPGIAVVPGHPPPTLEVRRPFSASLTELLSVGGGMPPYRFAPVSGFPFGIGLDPVAMTLIGSPRRSGSVTLTIRVTDTNGAKLDQTISLEVLERLHLAIGRLPSARVGKRYHAVLRATGGTGVVWRIASGELPAGVRLNPATGGITGTPRHAGVYRLAVSARDALGAAVSTRVRLTVR
jgi:large repetitive protein